MLQMVYGGSPVDWWALPPMRLAGFILHRAKAEAYASLRHVDELIVANPGFDQNARQRQIDRWKQILGIKEQEKPFAHRLQTFAEWGMQIEVVD